MKTALTLSAMALCTATALHAQSPVVIPSSPSCARCAVSLTPVVKLDGASAPAGFGILVQIAAAGNPRRYYASSNTFGNVIQQYGANGAFVRTIGRKGEGPGEFSGDMQLAVGRGDTIHAIEGRGRYHIIAPDGTIKRQAQMKGRVHNFVVAADGSIFASSAHGTPAAAFALQKFAPNGDALASIERLEGDAATLWRRFVALDAKQQLWSVAAETLDIVQWTKDGRPAKRFAGKRDWLINGPIPTRVEIKTEKPPGQIGALSFGADGNLYVFAMVPDANWKPQQQERPDFQKIWDTLIEVIDPASGALLARTRFDRMVFPIGGGQAYALVEDADGEPVAQIYTLSLKR